MLQTTAMPKISANHATITPSISLLQMNGKPKTVKEGIVSLLAKDWPLSGKQIFNKLKAEFNLNVSYQAVYKTIKLLAAEEIVHKNGKEFELNREWIKKSKELSLQLESTYSNPANKTQKEIGNFEFNTLYESDMFLLDYIISRLPEKKEAMAWQWSHYWIPLFISMKEYQKINEIKDNFEIYSVVRGKSAVDKWCSDFWNKNGSKTDFGKNFKASTDTIVFREYVIQAHYPTELSKKLDKFFNKAKKIEDIDVTKLFQTIFLDKTKIIMTINKNKELAERIKKETKKILGE